jgi:lipid-A-disaccharide synthase
MAITVGIVAGEASGDLLGSRLIRALKKHYPDIEFVGIAGPKMISEGAKSLYAMDKLSLHGYGFDVLSAIPGLIKMRRQLTKHFIANPPKVFIGIDAPDFNFALEKKLKDKGISTIHYVSPSIWAWRKGRMGKIKRAVNHILTLFPFEQALYEAHDVKATYVGHPLADEIPIAPNVKDARDQLKLPRSSMMIALLPGSRVGEVKRLAELYVKTAQKICKIHPDALFLVPLISRETRLIFEEAIYADYNQGANESLPNFKILFGHAHLAMQAADLVVVASGTATLEAALLKRPMVITYRMPWLSWQILKRMNYLPYVGLPNILAGRFVVPELLQNDANPDNLSDNIMRILRDKNGQDEVLIEFTRIHELLRQNNEEKAALAVLPYLV